MVVDAAANRCFLATKTTFSLHKSDFYKSDIHSLMPQWQRLQWVAPHRYEHLLGDSITHDNGTGNGWEFPIYCCRYCYHYYYYYYFLCTGDETSLGADSEST